jgi:hypothetical protein
MKKISIFAVALGLLMVVAAAQPAFAVCSNARLMSSGYIYTPGTVYEYAVSGDTVTDLFAGTFWALGEGDPVLGAGADSGSFPALDWLYNFGDYGYAAFIGGAPWATDARVDGCIDATPSTCTAIQLTDVNPETGEPVFALLTAEQDTAKNYSFFDGRIDLAPLPPVSIPIRPAWAKPESSLTSPPSTRPRSTPDCTSTRTAPAPPAAVWASRRSFRVWPGSRRFFRAVPSPRPTSTSRPAAGCRPA